MNSGFVRRAVVLGLSILIAGQGLSLAHGSQDAAAHVAAIKANMAASQAALRHYEWIETTVVSHDGDEKSRLQNRCYYGAEGTLQKVAMTAPPPPQQQRGLRGKIAANKQEEMTETMQNAVALVHQYIPPDPAKIDAVKTAQGVSMQPGAAGTVTVSLANYLKSGDTLAIQLNMTTNEMVGLRVNSYLDSPDDAVTVEVTMGKLPDGTVYAANTVLNLPKEKLSVAIDNAGYRKTS